MARLKIMKGLLIAPLFLLILPIASMGQRSSEATRSYTTQSGETVTINTTATVTQESYSTYDVNVNRSISASGTTNATGDIDTTAQSDGTEGATSTLTTTYNSSLGADGTKTIQSQDHQLNSSITTSQGTLTMHKSEGDTSVVVCGSSNCESAGSVKSYDNGVIKTTYTAESPSGVVSASSTYSGTNNGTSSDSTRTITTASGETVTIKNNDTGGVANKTITASGTTSGTLTIMKSEGDTSVTVCGSSNCESAGSVKGNDNGVMLTTYTAETPSGVVGASSTYSGTNNGTSE